MKDSDVEEWQIIKKPCGVAISTANEMGSRRIPGNMSYVAWVPIRRQSSAKTSMKPNTYPRLKAVSNIVHCSTGTCRVSSYCEFKQSDADPNVFLKRWTRRRNGIMLLKLIRALTFLRGHGARNSNLQQGVCLRALSHLLIYQDHVSTPVWKPLALGSSTTTSLHKHRVKYMYTIEIT